MLAEHVRLRRLTAIKSIHGLALADEVNLHRLYREAKLLALTDCPWVVRVYDVCRFDGLVQVVMEYVPGQPLSEILRAGPLSAREGLPILGDVAEALSAGTARGVVHRDVKPGNVFVLPNGHAKLGDFGLARIAADPSVFRTIAGPPVGTPAYFPPEVSQGLAEPDERSDAYSFAVMAYETLTGKRPFEGTDVVSLLTAHWRVAPPHPRHYVPGFPEDAAALLLRGMDKDPTRRLLPTDLVRQLASVAHDQWPTVARSATEPVTSTRGDPTVHVPGFRPGGPGPSLDLPVATTRASRWRFWSIACAVTTLCLLAGLGVVQIVFDGEAQLLLKGVEVRSDPPSGRVPCQRGEVALTAVFHTNGASGELAYQWSRPDGVTIGPRVLELSSGQREAEAQLLFTVNGEQPLRGQVVVQVLAPIVASAGHTIVYDCGGG